MCMTHHGPPADFQTGVLSLHRHQIQIRLFRSRLKVTCRSLVDRRYFAVFGAKLVLGLVDRIYVREYGNLQLDNRRVKVQPSIFAFELLDHHHDHLVRIVVECKALTVILY